MTLAQPSPHVIARLDASRASASLGPIEAGYPPRTAIATLHHGDAPVAIPAGRTLVSHVLRHSSTGMDVRSSTGQRSALHPGAMLVCNGPDLVVLRGPAQRGGDCLVVDLLLSGLRNPGLFLHLDDYYPTFVNSPHGCVRLLLGAWDGHRALAVSRWLRAGGPLRRMTSWSPACAPSIVRASPVAARWTSRRR